MYKRKILMTDDDSDLAMIVQDMLTSYHYEVDLAENAMETYDKLEKTKYDLLILDVNLPDESGLALCKEIRRLSALPIIFLSARDTDMDKIAGLDIGGDDYMGKPFSSMELLSRVNSLMRRTYGMMEEAEIIYIGAIEVNPVTRVVKKNGTEIKMTLKEFDVLHFLAKNKNKVVNKETLLKEVWGIYYQCEASTLSVHIRWLREKLEEDPTKPRYIKTLWRVGYTLCDGEA